MRDPLLGEVLAERYRIERELGRGGMGVVYLAEHVILEKKVALKLLPADLARAPDAVERFLQEARAASRIGHENIVDVSDFGAAPDGSPFFVMEFLDGKDLADCLRDDGPFAWERALLVARQIAAALAVAHEKRIVHRDLKPANLFLVERGGRRDIVKIVDFGIAKILDQSRDAKLTRAGTVLGTPAYMAPEQAREQNADHRVDVYALGCILYELLTGSVPFDAPTPMGVFSKHLFDEPEPFIVRAPFAVIPPEVEAMVMHALAKDPEQRFFNMAEMGAAITRCLGGAFDLRESPSLRQRRVTTTDHLALARAALQRGDSEGAFDAAEHALAEAGAIDSPDLLAESDLLVRIYERILGDRRRHVALALLPSGLDARAAFLLSRIDSQMSLDDLLDVSGMPRLESTRLVSSLLRHGILIAGVA